MTHQCVSAKFLTRPERLPENETAAPVPTSPEAQELKPDRSSA